MDHLEWAEILMQELGEETIKIGEQVLKEFLGRNQHWTMTFMRKNNNSLKGR